MKYLLLYLLSINALSLWLMHNDKQRARKRKWRIPESTLMTFAAIGGSIGALLGMCAFRHKTRHKKFTIGIPLIMIAHLALIGWYVFLR